MIKIKNVDIAHGPLLRSLITYCIPLMLVSLVQSLFTAVDIVVLDAVTDGSGAVASVGATTAIIHLLINAFFGISTGVKVVLARLIGAGEEEKTKATVSTSMLTSLFIGITVAVVGFFLSPLFLRLTDCPADCFEGALLYMRIYLAASPAIMLYNFGSSVLSVSGDTQRPLYYMIISGLLNVVLNFALCLVLTEKVAAVAIATAASQLVGAVLVVIRLVRNSGICRLDLRHLRFSPYFFWRIMVNGLPIGFCNALLPLSNLQIQAEINAFGSAAIAGNTAATSLEGIVGNICSSPFATAVGVFVGQNLGADKPERVKKSIRYSLSISVGLGIIIGVGATLLSPLALRLFTDDAAAIAMGQDRMRHVCCFYAIACANGCLSHIIQSFGYSAISTANSIFSVFCFRLLWMKLVYVRFMSPECLYFCFTVSWTLMLLINIGLVLWLYYGKFKKGKLKRLA